MIKKKVKLRKKNPFTNTNDVKNYVAMNSSSFKWIGDGAHANVYKFKTNKKIVLQTKILSPGEYILKILKNEDEYWNTDQINYLTILSKYGLIPKIFIITKNYFIGRYIHGFTLSEIEEMYNDDEIDRKLYLSILDKYYKLLDIWYKLKFKHNDTHNENILVSIDFKHVYLIDPI